MTEDAELRHDLPDVLSEGERLSRQLWSQRIATARVRYEAVAAELRRAIELHPVEVSGPVGWQTILEVRFRESEALSDYLEILRAAQ